MKPFDACTDTELFETVKEVTVGLSTIVTEMVGDLPYPDPREFSAFLQEISAEQFMALHSSDSGVETLRKSVEFTPVLLDMMNDLVAVQAEVLRRVTQ